MRRYTGHVKRFLFALAGLLPALYYGNTAGLRNNLLSRLQIRKFQKDMHLNDSFQNKHGAKQAEHLQRFGYVFLPKNVKYSGSLNRLKSHIAECIREGKDCAVSPNGATVYILDPEKLDIVSDFLTQEIKSVIFSYYQAGFYIKSVRIWRNRHVESIDPRKTDVYSNTFHHDNTYVTGLRVFIYLNDNVNSDTGALKLHDIRASKNFVRSLRFFQRDLLSNRTIQQLNTAETLKYFNGDSGDVAIVNVQDCLHSAGVPRSNAHRDVLQFEIYPSGKFENDNNALIRAVPRDVLLDPFRA